MTFTVTLHPAERAFDVARDETILSAAIRAGVGLRSEERRVGKEC